MDYSNVVSLHNFEGEAIAVVTWFSTECATLTKAKEIAQGVMKETNWCELCFSSCTIGSSEPIYVVIEENVNYGEQN